MIVKLLDDRNCAIEGICRQLLFDIESVWFDYCNTYANILVESARAIEREIKRLKERFCLFVSE